MLTSTEKEIGPFPSLSGIYNGHVDPSELDQSVILTIAIVCCESLGEIFKSVRRVPGNT